MHPRTTKVLTHLSKPIVALGGAVIVAIVVIGIALQSSPVTPSGQYVAATMAPITAVGGATSDLSFQVPGQVVAIPVSIGQEVSLGTVLVALDRSSLQAARAGAVANLEAQQAKLASLTAGTRPEQLAINQTAIAQAQNALTSALSTAYTNADDAIHAKADQMFANPKNTAAQLTIIVPDSALVNRIVAERIALEPVLVSWQAALTSATADNAWSLVASSEANMRSVATFLNDLTTALAETQSGGFISAATIVGYQTSTNAGRLNVAASLSALISADTSYKAAAGALTLAQAGATENDIAAQKAIVDAAQAAVSGIDVSLRQSTIVAPITGTVTALNAHLGQTVAPGQIIVSIESSGGKKDNALVIPTSSVIESDGQAFVYVKGDKGPIKTVVTTGLISTSGMTEIVSGLTVGQEVLTFGTSSK